MVVLTITPALNLFYSAFRETVALHNPKDQTKIQKSLCLADNSLDLLNLQYLPVWKTELNIKHH